MRCPTLSELPSPPPGKSGWPWTEESPQLPGTMPDGRPWPRVSIVTPSYNQAQFIEETIRSVLLQGYPGLEYIIIDGGSTDGSVDIIRKYEHRLAYWVSAPDKGQSDAINKGWRRARGSILAYLNSDDLYLPGAVRTAVQALIADPMLGMIYGDCEVIDTAGRRVSWQGGWEFDPVDLFRCHCPIPQQTVFIRREALDAVGMLDPELQFAIDYDLWTRITLRFKVRRVPVTLACFRDHAAAKSRTMGMQVYTDLVRTYTRLLERDDLPTEVRAACEEAVKLAPYLGHLWAGLRCYAMGSFEEAREHLWGAVICRPQALKTPELFRIWLHYYYNFDHYYGAHLSITPSIGQAQDCVGFVVNTLLSDPKTLREKAYSTEARVEANAYLALAKTYAPKDMGRALGHLSRAIRRDPSLLVDRAIMSRAIKTLAELFILYYRVLR